MATESESPHELTAEAVPHSAGLVDAHSSAAHEETGGNDEQSGHAVHDPMAAETLMEHVKDADYFHIPRVFSPETNGHIKIPQLPDSVRPEIQIKTGFAPLDQLIEPLDFRITKFMVLELVAAILLVAFFVPLAHRVRKGARPRGRIWNLLEAMVVFIRDQVARPTVGSHDADRFTPFLLTIFFFVLACNLLGLVPWAGSPTGALATTGALALITFATVVLAGSLKLGAVGFWVAQVPQMDVPLLIKIPLVPMIFAIEVLGLCIRHFVLAMRLLANMMAGHVVLAVIVAFIAASAGSLAFYGIVPFSVLGAIPLNLLELFVAFLQAYIFVFLSGLFIGMAVHPH